MLVFDDKKKWAAECARRGAVNHLSEISTYTDLGQQFMQEYATQSSNRGLIGVWHPVKKIGHIYNKPRQQFSTKDRKFKQEKITDYL